MASSEKPLINIPCCFGDKESIPVYIVTHNYTGTSAQCIHNLIWFTEPMWVQRCQRRLVSWPRQDVAWKDGMMAPVWSLCQSRPRVNEVEHCHRLNQRLSHLIPSIPGGGKSCQLIVWRLQTWPCRPELHSTFLSEPHRKLAQWSDQEAHIDRERGLPLPPHQNFAGSHHIYPRWETQGSQQIVCTWYLLRKACPSPPHHPRDKP